MTIFAFLKAQLRYGVLIAGLPMLISCAPGSAGTAGTTLTQPVLSKQSWLIQNNRENGSAFTAADVGGYRVYYGTVSGVYTKHFTFVSTAASFRINLSAAALVLSPGNYFAVVTVYDKAGRESGYSPEVKITV